MTSSKKCTLLVVLSLLAFLSAALFKVLGPKLWLGFEALCLLVVCIAALVTIIAVIYIGVSSEIRNIRGKILILVQILVAFFVGFGAFSGCILNIKARRALTSTSENTIRRVGNTMLSYASETDNLPDKGGWCDSIMGYKKRISSWHFKIAAKQDAPCSFVFNYNLSKLPIDGLAPNAVLIFEADGPWNFSGGPELFPGTRYRDQYFPWKERFAFIFLVDGTLLKYRLHDAAIAVFDEEDDKFGEFLLKNDPNYITIKWNESTNKRMLFEK